jgi:hypothetical protein
MTQFLKCPQLNNSVEKIVKQSREGKSMNGTIEVGDNLDLLALHASDFTLCFALYLQ